MGGVQGSGNRDGRRREADGLPSRVPDLFRRRPEKGEAAAAQAVLQDVDDFAAAVALPVWSRQSKAEKPCAARLLT